MGDNFSKINGLFQEPDPFLGRQEMAKDGYGVTLYDINDGKRKSLSAVVMRFKRLDWGAWIRSKTFSCVLLIHAVTTSCQQVHLTTSLRPKAGRDKKLWKKSQRQQVVNERHVFCKSYHKRR